MKINSEAEKIMIERFGKDTIIALATTKNGVPYVRKQSDCCSFSQTALRKSMVWSAYQHCIGFISSKMIL